MFGQRKLSLFSLFIIIAVLLASLGSPIAARAEGEAESACGDTYTVVRGDTLGKIASRCGTTVSALLRANPQIKRRNLIYPGQLLWMPGAVIPDNNGFAIYIVQRGDTLNSLAKRFDTTVKRLLALNENIKDPSVIYEGHRLVIPWDSSDPGSGDTQIYVVKKGDTLYKIAVKFNTTVDALLKLNPQIKNANRIFVGQRLVVPADADYYTVQRGDTLSKIAVKFNTTVQALLKLNPQIKNASLIYVGQVIRIR